MDGSSNYYYSNGLVYSNNFKTASIFLNKIPKIKKQKSLMAKMSMSLHRKKGESSQKYLNSSCTLDYQLDKRAKFGKGNLKSLDENVLNSYRNDHKINSLRKENRVNNFSTIVSTSNNSTNKLKILSEGSRKLKLTSAHPNFISLRNDDSVTKNWLKPFKGLDNAETISEYDITSAYTNNNSRVSENSNKQINITPKAIREINPSSSVRRYMFINSRRSAKVNSQKNNQSCKQEYQF